MTCPPKGCLGSISDPRLIISGTAFFEVEQDCNAQKGVLFLTDDAGLLSQADPTLGTWLDETAEISVKEIQSSALTDIYSICSPTYRNLVCAFNYVERGAKILVGLVKTGETFSEAFTRITACAQCAMSAQVVTERMDGSLVLDTAEYVDFIATVNSAECWITHATTLQAREAFINGFGETTSLAYGSAILGQDVTWNVASSYCAIERDANCEAVIDPLTNLPVTRRYVNNTGLHVALLHAQEDPNSTNYNYTLSASETEGCETGEFLDNTSGDPLDYSTWDVLPSQLVYSPTAIQNLTGLQDQIGAPILGATRHMNAFINVNNKVSQTVRYFSGIMVEGKNYGDEFYKKVAIDTSINVAVLRYMDSNPATLDLAGRRALANIIATVYDGWITRGLINPDPFDWGAIPNILINGFGGNGEGYYIAATPGDQLNTSQIASRASYFIQSCFNLNTPQQQLRLSLCELPPIALT